jgi:hypothetical protein
MSYLRTKDHMPSSNHSIFTAIQSKAKEIFAGPPHCYFTLHNKLNNTSLYFSEIYCHTLVRDPKVSVPLTFTPQKFSLPPSYY